MKIIAAVLILLAGNAMRLAQAPTASIAPSRPDFSGRWFFDPDRNPAITRGGLVPHKPRVLVITQTAATLTLVNEERDGTKIGPETVLNLDCSPTKNVHANRMDQNITTCAWDGAWLKVTDTRAHDGRSLSKSYSVNGDTLTWKMSEDLGRGPFTVQAFYSRLTK